MSRNVLVADAVALAASGAYPEREERAAPWYDQVAEGLQDHLWRPLARRIHPPALDLRRIVTITARHAEGLATISDEELRGRFRALRTGLRRRGFEPELVGRSFALVREVAGRTLGQRHFDVQLMAAWALLQGRLAEMATGEGKTLTATLAAATAALAGVPVHVITVNDYLARRDAVAMAPLYGFLGLTVGIVVQDVPPPERRLAYARDVVYCTNKDLAFDYLRDRVALSRRGGRLGMAVDALRGGDVAAHGLLLRGLCFGIVDEADSVFIDEARTPLILSANVDGAQELEMYRAALGLARRLQAGADYHLDERARHIALTDAGQAQLAAFTTGAAGVWTSPRARQEMVVQALSALLLFHPDRQYVVADGKVQIVDEFTGRTMPDRSWERGLHQMIEAKEGCELSARRETLARITYQRLFRRYVRLSGMTGTAREVAAEVWQVYRLPSVGIPLHRPVRRYCAPPRLYADADRRWSAVADTVQRVSQQEARPVLVGTRSVAASERLSQVLAARGVPHALLNARQDQAEAAVVAAAGAAGRVTVATNMAGRGTDIRLDHDVAARGGLHVILTECHGSARIDRQLFGRCARQGDPGSCETIVALDDEVFRLHAAALVTLGRWLMRPAPDRCAPAWLLVALRRLAQWRAERQDCRIRRDTLKNDQRLEEALAFSGKHE